MRSKKAIINIISSLILQAVNIISNLIIPIVIIRSFGSDVNGLVTSITQFLAYITLLESGFGPVVKSILYKPIANKNKEEIERILKASEKFFRIISYIFIGYIIVLCFVLPTILAKEFNALFTLSLVIIISISTFAEYYFGMTYRLYLQAEQKTYITSFIQIGTTILNTIMIVILIYIGANIQIVKLVSAVIFVLRPIIQNIYVKRKYNINLKSVKEDYKIKQKWDGLAQHIASVIHGNTDITIITIFCNLAEVSVYSVYSLVVKGVKSIIQAFTSGIEASFGDMLAKNEKENLNKKFELYEVFYFTITTIIFVCTMILIVPFVEVYTKGITDANYIRKTFAYLIVISEFICMLRMPYISLTYAAGHFKETRVGAWIEALTNIIISIILVFKYGIIGVAIGTIIAMAIRTAEFIYHTSKYILKRNIMKAIMKIILIIVESLIIILISEFLPELENISYLNWIINAIIVFILSAIVTVGMNVIFFKKQIFEMFSILKSLINRRKKGEDN